MSQDLVTGLVWGIGSITVILGTFQRHHLQ
jgi:hypothetical protein